ncbi:MAG: aminotransferase class I/II-fold pyridoxal phosphate-dependent enzyme, partial [Bacteroidia bacterium]|nr:aminotransferase class I/II-fold pyridoxal phosphate-dependent enzyme [Bacteroidia bacterium]
IDNKKVFLIVDEAHSFGVMGKDHLGLFNVKELAQKCVARIIGYGKSLGFAGAAVVGSAVLKKYLVNFCRSFIYSTALPLYHYQVLALLYEVLLHSSHKQHQLLKQHINFYLSLIENRKNFSKNNSPIQYFRINEEHYQNIQHTLIENKIFAKVILPPTVPKGAERVRISLHSFNTTDEISHLVRTLQTFEND